MQNPRRNLDLYVFPSIVVLGAEVNAAIYHLSPDGMMARMPSSLENEPEGTGVGD